MLEIIKVLQLDEQHKHQSTKLAPYLMPNMYIFGANKIQNLDGHKTPNACTIIYG